MRRNKLLESLSAKSQENTMFRRYNLSEIISESYKTLYDSERGSNLQKLVEAHLEDVRNNPTDIDRLSRQLCNLKYLSMMVESKKMEDEELLVPEEEYSKVVPDETIEESKEAEEKEVVEENDKTVAGDIELSDEELEELAKHLEEIRKNKKTNESSRPRRLKKLGEAEVSGYTWDSEWSKEYGLSGRTKYYINRGESLDNQIIGTIYEPDGEEFLDYGVDIYDTRKNDILAGTGYDEDANSFSSEEEAKRWVENWFSKNLKESSRPRRLKRTNESSSWDRIPLTEFKKKSATKAFVKTFRKLDSKLREGAALTRQESIALYKAANSAMTQLSVELEYNPEFLNTFRESTQLLSVDVSKLLGSLMEGKAPSKATMKSLAKFSEALLYEEEEEELPPIEDEDVNSSEESEEFDQEYAEARVELHKELAKEHEDSEDPDVQEKLSQDAEEVTSLPGITEEQVAEIVGEEESEEEEAPVEDESDSELEEEEDITDEELAALKKHLKEMRDTKKNPVEESTKPRKLLKR